MKRSLQKAVLGLESGDPHCSVTSWEELHDDSKWPLEPLLVLGPDEDHVSDFCCSLCYLTSLLNQEGEVFLSELGVQFLLGSSHVLECGPKVLLRDIRDVGTTRRLQWTKEGGWA